MLFRKTLEVSLRVLHALGAILFFYSIAGVWLLGCAPRRAPAPIPGCQMAQVSIPKECGPESYIQVEKDKTTVVCVRRVIVNGKVATETRRLTYHCDHQAK